MSQTAVENEQTEMPLNVMPLPLKREFVTTWSSAIVVLAETLPAWLKNYFGFWTSEKFQIYYPAEIKSLDLRVFYGRKTRITIEVIE